MKKQIAFAMTLSALFASTSSFAAQKYLYFIVDGPGEMGKPFVYNLNMEPVYKTLFKTKAPYGTPQLTCTYKARTGALEHFSLGYQDCEEMSVMSLDVALGQSRAMSDSIFVDHQSIGINTSLDAGKESFSMSVMSATRYQGISKLSGLPSIDRVPSASMSNEINPDNQAPGTMNCRIDYIQYHCAE